MLVYLAGPDKFLYHHPHNVCRHIMQATFPKSFSSDTASGATSSCSSSVSRPGASDSLAQVPAVYSPPLWLKCLCGLALILMANQVTMQHLVSSHSLPAVLGKISLPEISFLVAFLAVGIVYLIKKLTVQLPLLCLLPIVTMALANLCSGTGLGGMMETAQIAMLLAGGTVLFAFMHRYMPSTTLVSVTLGLLLNLLVAICQDWQVGAFLTLAPKDVMELSWGFGRAVTGLFRSRIAFSLYLAVALAWCLPQWLNIVCKQTHNKLLRDLACLCLAILTIFYIPNGFIALTTTILIVLGGFCSACNANSHIPFFAVLFLLAIAVKMPDNLHVQSWKHSISILKGYDYAPDASKLFNQPQPVTAESGSEQAHELKSAHYDFIAALRLSADHPLHGVGSGNYQKTIGKAYSLDEDRHRGQLPNPVLNDIESDNQAGWGILLATVGIPATLAFALFLLGAMGANVRRHLEDMEDGLALHLGAGLALAIFILAMFMTDPLTKGLGWFLALVVASAETGPATRKYAFIHPANSFPPLKLFCFFCLTVLSIAVAGASLPCCGRQIEAAEKDSCTPAPAPTATPSAIPEPVTKVTLKPAVTAAPVATAPASKPETDKVQPAQKTPQAVPAPKNATAEAPRQLRTAPAGEDLFLVFNANHANDITPPMRRMPDPQETYPQGILVIPDKAGTPPPGKKSELKYGGAVFECVIPEETKAYLWFNVMWDGSCGNTLDVSVDNSPTSYTVGNDGTYNAWHWQRSPKSYQLNPGRHTIAILNREDGIKVAQVLMVNDKEYVPEGMEEE